MSKVGRRSTLFGVTAVERLEHVAVDFFSSCLFSGELERYVEEERVAVRSSGEGRKTERPTLSSSESSGLAYSENEKLLEGFWLMDQQ